MMLSGCRQVSLRCSSTNCQACLMVLMPHQQAATVSMRHQVLFWHRVQHKHHTAHPHRVAAAASQQLHNGAYLLTATARVPACCRASYGGSRIEWLACLCMGCMAGLKHVVVLQIQGCHNAW